MGKSLRVAYGEAIVEEAKNNNKIVVLDGDLASATQTALFKKAYPDRFFDMGIAEQNIMGAAAGFAHEGLIPFASTFAIFGAGRAYEIIRNAIAYENLNVKIVLTHAGLSVGEDGGSHQSIEDIALMRVLPNMTVLTPCDEIEMKKAVSAAIKINGPVYIRASRPNCDIVTTEDTAFEVGKANVLTTDTDLCTNSKAKVDVCIIACGLMVKKALDAAEMLKGEGINATVVDMHTIKPLDKDIIIKYQKACKKIITVEEHSIIGGLGSAVAEVMASADSATIQAATIPGGARLSMIGINDKFGHSATPDQLFEEFGLTAENIVAKAKAN